MNKRKLHHVLVQMKAVPTLLMLGLAVFFAVMAIFALRANNQRMIELRDAVYAADEKGEAVEDALKSLRVHVYSHMNTDLTAGENAIRPPIQLKYTFERLLEAEQKKLQNTNTDLYDAATKHCEALFPAGQLRDGRVPCVAQYIDQHGQGVQVASVPEDLYKFDFVSPKWSPDLAGWSIVLAVLFLLLFVAKVIIEYVIKLELE